MNLTAPKFLICLVLIGQSVHSLAETYELSLTRKGSNVYKVDGKNIIIQTKFCYAYAFSESSILKSDGYGGKLIFLESKDQCDVKAAYALTPQTPGNFKVTVSRDNDDWYEIFGMNSFIKTSMCLSLALGEDAILTIIDRSYGYLLFKDGTKCMVEGVYHKIKL